MPVREVGAISHCAPHLQAGTGFQILSDSVESIQTAPFIRRASKVPWVLDPAEQFLVGLGLFLISRELKPGAAQQLLEG